MPIELFVADHHEQRLRSAGVPETRRSTDPRSLFTRIDAAVVITPTPTHFDTCRELLEMGKDVFVEKPITLVSSDAKKLAELAEKSGLVLQVGHIFRFDPASLWLRDAIAAERFGRLKMLRARFSGFKRPRLRVQRFEFNCGESAASWAGIQAARGRHIATLDADLQNDPKDLPAMLEALKQADCVCGTRAATRGKGDNWIRIASSHIANWVRNKLSGENISDAGCTYRVFKRECIGHV